MEDEIEWEQVESPEYISYCEANNQGYTEAVSTCGNWIRQKVWCSDDKTNKEHRTITMSTYNPFEEKRIAPEPYRITFLNGTYVDPITKRANFINSLPQSVFIPLGTIGTPNINLGIKYKPKDDDK